MSHGSLKRRVAFALGLVVLAIVAWLWIKRGQDRRSLAAYKAQLIAQGEKLSLDEVVSPPATADDPDYRQFQAAARRLQGRPIQPGGFNFLEFVAPGELRPLDVVTNLKFVDFAPGAYNPLDFRQVVTWTMWEAEVQAMRPHLDELRRALRSPAPRSDIDYRVPGARGPDFVLKREAAQWLAGEAMAALRATNHTAASESLKALLALTELHREDPTLVNQMMQVAISGLAFEVTCVALQLPDWSESQLADLQAAWQRTRFFDRMVTSMEGERAWFLAHSEQARTNGFGAVWSQIRPTGAPRPVNPETVFEDFVLDPMYRHAWAEEDQLFFLRTYQGSLEALRAARQHKSWPKLAGDLGRTFQPMETEARGLNRLRHRLSLMAVPNWKRATEMQFRAETQRSLCLTVLALHRYELQHAQLPADLAALTPELLDTVPADLMDGQPLRYRVEVDGTWRLYSVGLDGKDDGGEALPAQAWGRYTSIWDGSDAVWPQLGSAAAPGPVIPPSEVLPLIQFDNAPLRDAMITLARQIELNLVFDPAIEAELKSRVNLRLENVSASDALRTVLDSRKLAAKRHPTRNVVRVTRQ
jgi:hypothetical protein